MQPKISVILPVYNGERFLSAGGSEREIYEVFAKTPKIWQMLTSPRNKSWNEKIFSVKKYRSIKVLTILGYEIRYNKIK